MQTARGANISRSAVPGEAAVTYRVFRDGRELTPDELPAQLAAATGESVPPFEMELVFPNGRSLFLFAGATPLLDAAGKVHGAVMAGVDVTSLHQLQERERRYLYTLAHNLRAPASIIKGNLQYLLQLLPGEYITPHRTIFQALERGLYRMNTMIDDFNLVTRLEEGSIDICPEPVALKLFLNDLLQHSEQALETNRLHLDVPPDLPPVQADPEYLQTIVINLLDNAQKFSKPDTPIHVTGYRQDGEVVISVADQGIGIAPEDLPHIFDRFYRVGLVRKAEGTGLGLYIVKRLVEIQGGRIRVESEVGKGSTFYCTLPVAHAS